MTRKELKNELFAGTNHFDNSPAKLHRRIMSSSGRDYVF